MPENIDRQEFIKELRNFPGLSFDAYDSYDHSEVSSTVVKPEDSDIMITIKAVPLYRIWKMAQHLGIKREEVFPKDA